jgi:hypothetical protein
MNACYTSYACHMPRSISCPLIWWLNRSAVWWRAPIMKFLIMNFSPVACYTCTPGIFWICVHEGFVAIYLKYLICVTVIKSLRINVKDLNWGLRTVAACCVWQCTFPTITCFKCVQNILINWCMVYNGCIFTAILRWEIAYLLCIC